MEVFIQYAGYLLILVGIGIPLGAYMGKVMNGEKVFLSRLCLPCENFICKIMRIDKNEQMTAKKYIWSIIIFHLISFAAVFFMLLCQKFLPLNPEEVEGMPWDLAFNTAVSFVTNTDWQAYCSESALSCFSQMIGLTVQNFVSAATGIAVLFAVIRGFIRVKSEGIGSFWVDLIRIVLYILLPLSFISAVCLVSQGVVQTFQPYDRVCLLEPVAVDRDGEIIRNARIDLESGTVTVGRKTVKDASIITAQVIPLGTAASQIAIKQLGSNGGGFFGANSSHPFENPTVFSNLLEMLSILLIPTGLCFTFGRNVKDKKQGIVIFLAMFILLTAATVVCAISEQAGTPQLLQDKEVEVYNTDSTAGGNMEGKETRFGIASSVTWAVWTTAASNGSVNSMHDSYTPLGGLVHMVLMQLGEVVFGGVGCGLYGMLGFAVLTVFIAGLMVGRTPEYLGKKIEPFEMKMAVLCCLAVPMGILAGSGVAALLPDTAASLNNTGTHGLSEILYTYSSTAGNNGSAFAGFRADTLFVNVSTGLIMLLGRFVPMIAMTAAAGSLAGKKKLAATAGTLITGNGLFVCLLIFVILLVGALSFFPALVLGPIAEYVRMSA